MTCICIEGSWRNLHRKATPGAASFNFPHSWSHRCCFWKCAKKFVLIDVYAFAALVRIGDWGMRVAAWSGWAGNLLAIFHCETYPYDLWTRVVWAAAGGLQHAASWLQGSHPKVGYLNVILLVQQQILRLQVAMAETQNKSNIDWSSGRGAFNRDLPNRMRVAEIQGGDDLPEELARLLRRQSTLLHQVIEELSAGYMLQYQIQILLVLVHIAQAKDVWMID